MNDFQVILFVGQPASGEDPERLQAHFADEPLLTLLHIPALGSNAETIEPLLNGLLPDLIFVFADSLKAQGEDVLGFCSQLRGSLAKHRPVLIVQSNEPEDQRIRYLVQGADDVFDPDLSPGEFKVRLLVHLRRNLDFTANEVTQLPSLQFAAKVVQRRLNQSKPVALLTIELDHFDVYSEVYGELPARQVLKTFAALLGRLVLVPDFVSHTDENNFVITTTPEKAEKLAAMLARQFETVSPNLYSEKDRKQGYMISVIADNISRRVPLMSLSIGISNNQTQPFDSFTSLFNATQQMKTLARMAPGSSWQSDRLRLAGSQSVTGSEKPQILVLETDAALAYLLKTTLEMEGYGVDVVSSAEDARQILDTNPAERLPNLVILDALINGEESGLALAGEIHAQTPQVSIICASSLNNRQRVLQAGVDLYLPKPFELSSLFFWIHRLLQENA